MTSQMVPDGLTATGLEAKWKRSDAWRQYGHPFHLRMRRALSWLARAEREESDPDAAFIFYWIAFNAIYADDSEETYELREHEKVADFFATIAPLDDAGIIFNSIWQEHNRSIRTLLRNKYVYGPYWADNRNWRCRFDESIKKVDDYLLARKTGAILIQVFERLYVLRNQLLHGGATWRGRVNREQVCDGATIMAYLVPHFIDIMLDHPDGDWGYPAYPVRV